jgi:hypothetical protein
MITRDVCRCPVASSRIGDLLTRKHRTSLRRSDDETVSARYTASHVFLRRLLFVLRTQPRKPSIVAPILFCNSVENISFSHSQS